MLGLKTTVFFSWAPEPVTKSNPIIYSGLLTMRKGEGRAHYLPMVPYSLQAFVLFRHLPAICGDLLQCDRHLHTGLLLIISVFF